MTQSNLPSAAKANTLPAAAQSFRPVMIYMKPTNTALGERERKKLLGYTAAERKGPGYKANYYIVSLELEP